MQNRLNQQQKDGTQRREELDAELQQLSINEQTAREILSKDKAWIRQQEQAIQRLQKALQTSQIHLETAEKAIAEYFANVNVIKQWLDLDKIYSVDYLHENQQHIAEQLADIEQAQQAISKQLADVDYQLRNDDQKRKKAEKLQKDYDKQAKINNIWQGMKELIGSQNGSKFRNFAQSLTLEILISHANQRMQELNRRYALQRVPQTDLELQIIDREMGDEIRPVHSLSGGESFLVSLALALGLASLSSRKTQIDSLFIDEGFGTLDPQTLDTALSALDSLQAQGKTVCIISHVSAINERIATQIRVKACGNGRSVVELVA